MRVFAIVNQKGGSGKTTTAINLAAVFAARGKRTLLVDLDPQSHCAAGLGVPEDDIEFSVSEALLAEHEQGLNLKSVVWEVGRSFYLLPSTMRLAAVEAPGGGLHQRADRDRRLESLLKLIKPDYDVCLIDCSPAIGLLTFNALRAADDALIPVESGFFAMRGAHKQFRTVQNLISRMGRPLQCHLLATMYDPESKLATTILESLRRDFPCELLRTVIRRHEELREAVSMGQPILEYAPQSMAHQEFEDLADELERLHILAAPQEQFSVPMTESRVAPPISDRGHRAAELVARINRAESKVKSEAEASEILGQSLTDQPSDGQVGDERVPDAILENAPLDPPEIEVNRFLGAEVTSGGVRFVQPDSGAQVISVAGDFNAWAPIRLKRSEQTGMLEITVPLPEGRYRYQILVDGQAGLDSYNDQRQNDPAIGPCNVLIVG